MQQPGFTGWAFLASGRALATGTEWAGLGNTIIIIAKEELLVARRRGSRRRIASEERAARDRAAAAAEHAVEVRADAFVVVGALRSAHRRERACLDPPSTPPVRGNRGAHAVSERQQRSARRAGMASRIRG